MPADTQTRDTPNHLSNAGGLLLLCTGVLKGWIVLMLGSLVGYGLAAAISAAFGLPFMPVWQLWFEANNGIPMLGIFGFAGWVIEIVRVQGEPRGGSIFYSWAAAPRLRFFLFTLLGIAT